MNIAPRSLSIVKPMPILAAFLALAFAPASHAQQIEAEAWTTQFGLQTEATTDVGGGLDVGFIDPNDWAEYTNQTFAAGNWKVDARIATMTTNRQIQIYVDDALKTTITYTGNTAGWQNWVTSTSAQFNIATGGTHKVKLVFPGNNMNVNWIKFVPQVSDATPPSLPGSFGAPVRTNTGINFTWAAATDPESGIAGYDVVIDGGPAISLGNVTAYSAYGFAANSTHTLKVQARNGVGLVSGYPATAFSTTTTNAINLLTNGDFANGNANWTLYQGTSLNVAGEYAVSTPVTANVYDVNVWNKVAMTQGVTYTLAFRARSNLNRSIVGGWGFAQAPWTTQNQTFALSAVWQNYSVTLVSTVPTEPSSRAFFDVAGPIAGEVHIDDVVLSAASANLDVTPPTAPATLSSPTQSGTTIDLAWPAGTDNVAVIGYDVMRLSGPTVSLANTLNFQATGLISATSYSFQVRARDAAGNLSAWGPVFTVATKDVIPPSVPAGLVSPTQTASSITVAWTAATDNIAVTGYELSVDNGAAFSVGLATNFTVMGLAQGMHTFQVRAVDAAVNFSAFSAPMNAATFDAIAPTAPAGLASPAQANTTINLTWTAATDNIGVTGYNIYNNGMTLLASAGAVTAYQLTGLAPGVAYVLTVKAKDAAGNLSPASNAVNITTTNNDTQSPTVPTALASPSQTAATINLNWTASTDNVGVTAYEVSKGGVVLATVGNVLAYQAAGLAAGTAYTFTVRAKDAAGNFSANSNVLTVSTTNAATNLLTNGDFSNGFTDWTLYQGASLNIPGEYAINVPANGGNAWDINVWHGVAMTQSVIYTLTFKARSNVNRTIVAGWGFAHDPYTNQNQIYNLTPAWQDFVFTGVSTVPTDANSRVFFDVGGFAGEVHIDNVSLTNAAFVDNQAPTVPAAVNSPAQGQTSLNIAWTASTDNVAVTGYEIFVDSALNATVGAVNNASITGLVKATTYSIQVRAFDAAGNRSALSPAINATTANGQVALKIEAENWTLMNGLQTETTTDAGGGLNVGWIDANDWAEYANQPLSAGNYVVEARMAAMDVNRMADIWVDGQLKTTVTQPIATGGWQTWVTATSPAFSIAADGNHLIRVQFPNNNQNLNWIRFVPQAPDVTPPSIPTGLASTSQGGTSLSLSWTASTDAGSGVAGYRLYANGVLNATTGAVTAGTLTGLTVSTQYQVTLKAFDNAGNESGASPAVTVSTTDGTNLNGLYVLRDRNSGKCLEIAGGGLIDGAAAIQNDCNGSVQQKWNLILVNGSVYKLMNQASNKVLDVKGSGSTNDVQQWADVNGAAQQWRVLPVVGQAGHYTLNATSDLTECLDVLGANQTAGAAMQTLPCAGAVSQQFAFIATQAVTSCVAGPAPGNDIASEQWWSGVPFVQPMELVQEPAVVGDAWVVMEQTGMIRRVNNNRNDNTNTVFLNMQGKLSTAGESGLASLAFDPEYGVTNRYVYITYISLSPMQTRLSRFTASADYKTLDPNSEFVIYRFAQVNDIHHSGSLLFGPGPVNGTKYLYVTIGDNGSNGFGDLTPVKVTKNSWPNGKILRFNPVEYRGNAEMIWDFTDNTTNNLKWIVATGLRNAWRTSFDGDDLWISNVGFDMNEEINKFNVKTDGVPNFGWPWCEGTICCSGSVNCNLAGMPPKPADNLLKWPEHEYPRAEGNTNQGAVIAGFVYRGSALPNLVGKFIFADFVDKTIFALDPVTKVRTTLIPALGDIADIGQDRNGEIMMTDYGASKIWKIIPGTAQALSWPPTNLMDAGCFTGLNENDAVSPTQPGVNPFVVAQKFWSDGADKQRYISLPPGATVDVNDPNDWKLPPGGVTLKTFRWPATGKNFETRLFVRHTNGVYAGYTYKWLTATTATLVGANGDTKDLGGGTTWNYPSRSQCMTCHNDKVNGSIALETRQLNVSNQLANMSAAGILYPPNPPPLTPFPYHLDPLVPLSERATSYLHVNCATCHRGPTESSAGRATWDARYTTPMAQKKACNELPFEAISGDAANERIIKPGSSALSTVWLRAHQRVNNFMPPLASKVVDQEGVQMLADWVNQLSNCQ
jgi:chitodextrinase